MFWLRNEKICFSILTLNLSSDGVNIVSLHDSTNTETVNDMLGKSSNDMLQNDNLLFCLHPNQN